MRNDTDDELLAAAKELLGETTTTFNQLLQTTSGYPRADATLDDFERAIRDVARGLNEWLRAYDSEGTNEVRNRELDRQQPEG
jgi:hypothetical protein